jgi:hypothetical protein
VIILEICSYTMYINRQMSIVIGHESVKLEIVSSNFYASPVICTPSSQVVIKLSIKIKRVTRFKLELMKVFQ